MTERKAETQYLRRRVADSLAMAAAAAGPCAQIAHLTLARLYGEGIDALIARPDRPTFHALLANATRVDVPTGTGQAKPMILALADEERQLASLLLA